jgi:pimeloyl-ACP methyl ester carboxylesterase
MPSRRRTLVGWSDGACTALVLARQAPERVRGVFFFACNMAPVVCAAFGCPHPAHLAISDHAA